MARKITPWNQLSKPYRQRLARAGITAKSRREGTDRRSARGHKPPPRPGQAPQPLINLVAPTTPQRDDLRLWRATLSPDWLPNRQRMGDQTAAVLSQLRHPRTWKSVQFTPAPAGQPWTMEVTYITGYPQTVLIPEGTYLEVLDLLTFVGKLTGYVPDDKAWDRFIARGRDFDVAGTP